MDIENTKLKDRTLWYDGDNTVHDMAYLYNKLLNAEDISMLFVNEITPEIRTYNRTVNKPLTIKTALNALSYDWNIPEKYKALLIRTYILKKLDEEIANNAFSDIEIEQRIDRVETELKLWEANNMTMLLKTLIFMVDEFISHNIVWGTGRGSSCSCYVLFLIGLHDVDSVHYNLDIKEFFRN